MQKIVLVFGCFFIGIDTQQTWNSFSEQDENIDQLLSCNSSEGSLRCACFFSPYPLQHRFNKATAPCPLATTACVIQLLLHLLRRAMQLSRVTALTDCRSQTKQR